MNVRFIEKPKGFDTKMKIAYAITRPLSEMSVADICEAAGVSRQTFYSHFDSKYAIGPWYSHWCDSFTLAEIGRTLSWSEGYAEWFFLVEKEKALFTHTRQQKHIQEGLKTVASKRHEDFKTTITEYRGLALTEDLDYFARLCARIEGIVALEWFESGFRTPSDIMAKRMELCVPPPLHRVLDRSGKTGGSCE